MKTKETYYQKFEKEVAKQFDALKDEYKVKIEKAPKEFVIKAHRFVNEKNHKERAMIDNLLDDQKDFLFQISDELENDKDKKIDTLFNEKFLAIKGINKNELLKNLVKQKALKQMFDFLGERMGEYSSPNKNNNQQKTISNINWKGKELEFVQLIYALQKANYLDNVEHEITTLVKQVAVVFNYKLSEHWQTYLSDSVNSRKPDYQPKIFNNLSNCFKDYSEALVENNKKKKPQVLPK